MLSRIVIAVDGLAGSGKSTLARHLSQQLGFVHLNSGLLYRAVGLMALRAKIDANSETALSAELPKHRIRLELAQDHRPQVTLDGEDITGAVQTPEVSEATSQASQFSIVRQALMQMQREAYSGKAIVAEGRDMGTIVFPDSPLKFFVVADERIRIERRLKQLMDGSVDKSETTRKRLAAQIGIEIRERDKRDSERPVAPTKPALDAVIIDNSSESLQSVLARMVAEARKRGLVDQSRA